LGKRLNRSQRRRTYRITGKVKELCVDVRKKDAVEAAVANVKTDGKYVNTAGTAAKAKTDETENKARNEKL
jgi:hypothetical protein